MSEIDEINSELERYEHDEEKNIPQKIVEKYVTLDQDPKIINEIKKRFIGYISNLSHIQDIGDIANYGPYYDLMIRFMVLAKNAENTDKVILDFIEEEDIKNIMKIGLKQETYGETYPREIIEMYFNARKNKVVQDQEGGWIKKKFSISQEACQLVDFQSALMEELQDYKKNPFMKDISRIILKTDKKIKNLLSGKRYMKLMKII